MQDNTNGLYAHRHAELTTTVGFFTATQLSELYGADIAELVDNPAGIEGITATALDLIEDRKTSRTFVQAMVPTIAEVGSAFAAGWPAMFVNEEVLREFLAATYELPADWQATAAGVAELVEVLLLDEEMLNESGICLGDGWKVSEVTGMGGAVEFTIQQGDQLPVSTAPVGERTLIGLTKKTGVAAAVAALLHLAIEVNKRAAQEIYAAADKEIVTTALSGAAPAAAADAITFDRLSEILGQSDGSWGIDPNEVEKTIAEIRQAASA